MTTDIKTVIAQLNISGGSRRGNPPNQVAVREPKADNVPGAGKGDLFILTEVSGHMGEDADLERQLAETIRDSYYLSRGSVTASLRRALQATNEELYRYNQKVRKERQIVAGAVILVMQNEEAFIAQTGPTAFFAVLNNLIRRYPSHLSDGSNAGLGREGFLEPNLHHLDVTPEDMLILTDHRLASQVSLDQVVQAVTPSNAKSTIKNLSKTIQKQNGSALALGILAADKSALGNLTRQAPAQIGRLLNRNTAATTADELDGHPQPVPTMTQSTHPVYETAVSNQGAAEMDDTRRTSPLPRVSDIIERFSSQESQSAPKKTQKTSAQIRPTVSQNHNFDYADAPSRQATRELDSMAYDPDIYSDFSYAPQSFFSFVSFRQLAQWFSTGVLLFVALLGNGLKTMLSLVLPDQANAPRKAGTQAYRYQDASGASFKVLRNLVIVIPVIVGIVVGIIYLQQGRVLEAEYQQMLTDAQAKYQQAQAVAAEPGAALALIRESEGFLVEAETMKGTQPEITELRDQIRQTADEVGQVQRLYYLPRLRQYAETNTALSQIVVQGVELFVMDRGNNRIYHHQLDDLGETLLPDGEDVLLVGQGQQVGSVVVDNLVNMTWMPAGGNRQTSDLVILGNNGLLEYNPNWGMTTSALTAQETFISPIAVSSYFGNFYVLDPQANRLLRYLPTADGYSATPEDYFPVDQPVNLTGAVDLAIDGAIYVLYGNGAISKFQGGLPSEFTVTGLDVPFNNPVALFTAPDEEVQYIYVADAGNQRVVQLEKDGQFVRQFKPSAGELVTFSHLQDIFVDEISGRLYILDSNNLYVGNMPTLSE